MTNDDVDATIDDVDVTLRTKTLIITVALEVVIHISAVTPVAVTYHVSLQQFVPHHVSR